MIDKPNILLIEDEILIQKSLTILLEKRGANVTTCSNGRDGIEKINSYHFNRVICDLMLNDITGFEILEESKNKYSPQEISQLFVIITAYSSKQIIDNAARYNCPILSKPFEDINMALDLFLNIS